ncbi:MAG TPA: hypothetical protein VF657_02305 [Actinoplanes sp.]
MTTPAPTSAAASPAPANPASRRVRRDRRPAARTLSAVNSITGSPLLTYTFSA